MADLTIALAGNPNCGKTTLFNALTGARQHVGNYPGITVEKKEGIAKLADGKEVLVIDLPGTYSLTAYSLEEVVARRVLIEDKPAVVVDVVASLAIERNLYLAVQLLELGVPLVVAVNMMDEANSAGMSIDFKVLGEKLDAVVLGVTAKKNKGVGEVLQAAVDVGTAKQGRSEPLVISYGPDIDEALTEMQAHIDAHDLTKGKCPARWLALKVLEGDEEILKSLESDKEAARPLLERAEKLTQHMKATTGSYPEAVIADYRYGFLSAVAKTCVTRNNVGDRVAFSDSVDKVLTHALFGPLIMLGVLYAVYAITFNLGKYPLELVKASFDGLGEFVGSMLPDGLVKSLVVSGIIAGAGGVLGFVPLIMIIFALISFLDDSGYMSRIAYMLDRVFRFFGLHGCSVMPFIISGGIAGGCAVPGVMATRTLRSPMERLATMLTVPFMTCGAKLPVFILLTSVFFPDHQAWILFGLTLLGWATALVVSKILRLTIIRGASTPFVMELPPYRLPTLRGLLIHTWERTWEYIKKASTMILAISVLIWAAMTFPGMPQNVEDSLLAQQVTIEGNIKKAEEDGESDTVVEEYKGLLEDIEKRRSMETLRASFAGRLGLALEPVSKLAGFDWRTNIALIGGFAAKEVIISTLGTAYSLGEVSGEKTEPLAEQLQNDPQWSMANGLSMMAFILMYAPCFVTVVALARESGSVRWAFFSMGANTVIAFGVAVAIFQFGQLFGL